MPRKMEDDEFGLKGHPPMCPDSEVVTLSPILDTVNGMCYRYGSFSGEVPADPLGYVGTAPTGEVDTFPGRNEKRKR